MRLALGFWFLYHEAWEKIQNWNAAGFAGLIERWIQSPNGYPWYQALLRDVVLPNSEFFRYLVTYGEFTLAICLILGLGLRVVIPFQVFGLINFILAKTYASGAANLDRVTLICLVGLWLISAGRAYGLDGWLRRRFAALRWL